MVSFNDVTKMQGPQIAAMAHGRALQGVYAQPGEPVQGNQVQAAPQGGPSQATVYAHPQSQMMQQMNPGAPQGAQGLQGRNFEPGELEAHLQKQGFQSDGSGLRKAMEAGGQPGGVAPGGQPSQAASMGDDFIAYLSAVLSPEERAMLQQAQQASPQLEAPNPMQGVQSLGAAAGQQRPPGQGGYDAGYQMGQRLRQQPK